MWFFTVLYTIHFCLICYIFYIFEHNEFCVLLLLFLICILWFQYLKFSIWGILQNWWWLFFPQMWDWLKFVQSQFQILNLLLRSIFTLNFRFRPFFIFYQFWCQFRLWKPLGDKLWNAITWFWRVLQDRKRGLTA